MGCGAISGALGAFFSYLAEGIATGPAMVLVATSIFLVGLFFGPRGGLLTTTLKKRAQKASRKLEVKLEGNRV